MNIFEKYQFLNGSKTILWKLITKKYHLLLSCIKPYAAVIDNSSTESNIKEVFLGIAIERGLKFDDHVSTHES